MLDRFINICVLLMYRESLKELGLFTLEKTKGQISSRGLIEKAETNILHWNMAKEQQTTESSGIREKSK